ncbi:CotH kinase family protein [Anatilimnocola sp. NA78]|uniref:CotH kinase family protein n=1 Tax=Anatilimnocola sp. NA78 TaxID=3415683 RepID=UPI003CE4D2E7
MRGLCCLLICSGWLCTSLSAADTDAFGLTRVLKVDVTVSAADYAAMESPPATMFGGSRPPAAGRPAPGSADFGAGKFGFEFDYVRATVEIDGEKFPDVGLRYKGNGTYMMSAQQAKRSLKIDFDRYLAEGKWRGEKKLNLNSGVMDPTKAREALAYAAFNAAGIPAPRTSYAEVSLTVPGKFQKERLGVYTAVEQIDKSFLKHHFQNSQGLLLKPEGIRGLPHFGPEAKTYADTYNAKTDGTPEQWGRLIKLTQLINQADEAEFREQIGKLLDLDAFANFLAANTFLASLDGFIGMGHNYYLYLRPDTGKFVFVPWDLDLAFGAFPFYGTPQQLVDLSIEHPHLGENKLIDRLLAIPAWKAKYHQRLRLLTSPTFVAERSSEAETLEKLLQPLRDKDKVAADARKERGNGFGPGGGMFGATPIPLTTFLQQRTTSILAQLEGKKKGYVPTQGMGFGPPPGPGNQLAKPILTLLDGNHDGNLTEDEAAAGIAKAVRDWDKNKNGTLDQRELTEGLQKLLPPSAPPGPPRGP